EEVAGPVPHRIGQMGAAVAILTSSDRINAIQGDAGTGKSAMLRPVADILKADGHKVIGLAFQTKVASALREDTGIEAITVARFLIDHRGVLDGDKAATRESRAVLSGSYLVLDEASMIGNEQMLALTRIANITGVAALHQIGDRKQLLPIDSGKSFALSQAGGAATRRMTENLRQKTPELRAAATLSSQGKTGDAIRLLGDVVRSGPERNAAAADWWLALSPAERDTAAIFTSGKESRAAINARVQEGLRAEGSLSGPQLTVRVNEPVDRAREEMRYAKSYEPGMTLEVWKDVASAGLRRGEYRVARVFGNGKIELERNGKRTTFKPDQLPPSLKDDRLKLAITKEIKIQEGERIRWTTNDRDRELLNGTLSKVLGIDGKHVTIERPDKTVLVLEGGDPMLKHLDLAYALNMHMAQGMTADKGALVMGSDERFLANQRLAHVGLTRVREDLQIFTDDKDKLIRQIDRTSGDKTSALEVTGRLHIDKDITTAALARERQKPFDPGPIVDTSAKAEATQSKRLDDLYPGLAPTANKDREASVPQLSVPEKTKGMDI
ncbi:MAG: ATP-dependent DNA helicase, partial [Sphingomonas sp.]